MIEIYLNHDTTVVAATKVGEKKRRGVDATAKKFININLV